MKKVLIVFVSIIGLILLAAVLLPIIFKDDIRAALDKELDKSLNAEIYYDTEAFSLSLFKSFPDFSVTVGNFGVVGQEPFQSDTLVSVDEFNLTIDIMSVINGDQIKIVDVALIEPNIKVLVLEDGTANYDITKATEPTVEEEDESTEPLSIQIQSWSIQNAKMVYDDRTLPMVLDINDLNHSGSGDFAQDVFDMITQTSISAMTVSYDDIEYISNKSLSADLTMAMDFANMKFTFKENSLALNEFGFGFNGFLSMPDENIDMDINFSGKEITLRSVLSLIPGTYQEYLDGVNATGLLSFGGAISGIYNESSMPMINATFGISDGNVIYSDFPSPMEEININATFDYPSADLRETSFLMDKFHMKLDGEEISAYLLFKDFEDYFWDFRLDGNIDLEKVTKVIKLEDMTLTGKANAKIETKGRMSDLEAERYAELPTTGSLELSDFYYESEDLPQGFGISSAKMTLDPEAIALANFEGNAGRTDMSMSGKVSNYLQYVLADSAMLYGQLDFSSTVVDANEWMTEEEEETPEDTAALEVIRIPENIDFVLTSSIEKIIYDDLELKNFAGELIVRNGAVIFKDAGFNLLDGAFELNGSYDSKEELVNPLYDFDFAIKELSIASAFKSFTPVQKLVPVAEKMDGKFSTDFKLGGSLAQDMSPIYEEIQGAGLIKIAQASIKDAKLLSTISDVTKVGDGDGEASLKDVLLDATITDGRLFVEPFELSLGGKEATIGGSTGVDGSLDYVVSMDVPSGQVGDAVNQTLGSLAGMNNLVGGDITLNLGLQGTYDDIKVKLLGAKSEGGNAKSAVKAEVKDKIDEKKEEAKAVVNTAKDSAQAVVEEKKEEIKEEVKEEIEEVTDEAKDKAKDAIKDIFGKKKKKDGGL